eukprot:m.204232 g.204232  ORF g.204232 m.204232 type:complete len:634 (-) comp17743_c0_seq6:1109-3010(-)
MPLNALSKRATAASSVSAGLSSVGLPSRKLTSTTALPSPLKPSLSLMMALRGSGSGSSIGVYRPTFDGCVALANHKLLNGVCQSVPTCPAGMRQSPISLVVEQPMACTSPNYLGVTGVNSTIVVFESICLACNVPHCLQCPRKGDKCISCQAPYILFKDSCRSACPLGYRVNNSSGVPAFCEPCGQSSCLACPAAPNKCSQCPATGFSLHDFVCLPCSDENCVQCVQDADVCTACAPPFLLSVTHTCVTSCPHPTVAGPLGVCELPSSSSSGLSHGALAGVIVGILLLLAALLAAALFYRQRVALRMAAVGLKEQLLSSEAEVLELKRVWEIDPIELVLGEVVGSGTFGTVYKAKWGDLDVAVKKFVGSFDVTPDFDNEVSALRVIRHKNIVRFYGAGFFHDHVPFLVTELVERGSLASVLRNTSLSWHIRLGFAFDAANGIGYIHTLCKVHRDIKTSNMLVTKHFRVKIADFGTARMGEISGIAPDKTKLKGQEYVGSLIYCAPETLARKSQNYASDVFSFGMVLYEIFTCVEPWRSVSFRFSQQLLDLLLANERPPLPSHCPVDYAKLVTWCWQSEPGARPTMNQVIESSTFKEVRSQPDVERPSLTSLSELGSVADFRTSSSDTMLQAEA